MVWTKGSVKRAVGLMAITALAASPSISAPRKSAAKPPQVIFQQFAPERYGDWTVDYFGKGYGAYVGNGSGSVFGVYCSDTCIIYFNSGLTCDEGAYIPALFSTPAGSFARDLKCAKLDKRFILAGDLSVTLLDAMDVGGEMGIATALVGGQFKVTRFSLTGAHKSVTRAFDLSPAGQPETGKTLKDYTL